MGSVPSTWTMVYDDTALFPSKRPLLYWQKYGIRYDLNHSYTLPSVNGELQIGDYIYYAGPVGSSSVGGQLKYRQICRRPAVVAPTYQSTQTENQSLSCPAAYPSGSIIQRRTYELWSDGSKRNYSVWIDVSNSCSAIKQSTQNESRSLSCASGQTGSITQNRSYDLWTDGSKKNYSNWSTISNSCIITIIANPSRTEACSEGYVGKKIYEWVIKYKDVEYTTKDSNGQDITYKTSTPYQEEQLKNNTCTLIPTQVTNSENTSQQISCDNYYGVPSGTYLGSVYKYGITTTTYDSATKKTTSNFTTTSIDTTSCIAQINDMKQELKNDACPSGQTGNIQSYRYVSTDTKGATSYPYGENWIVIGNNCMTNDVGLDNPDNGQVTNTPESLLSNISISSNELQSNNSFSEYLNELSESNWKANTIHKLVIDITDLSTGTYDLNKIGNVITTFKSVVGESNSEIEVKIPNTIDKYIGIGEITKKSVENKTVALKNIAFDGQKATITYFDLSVGTAESPKELISNVDIFPKGMKINSIYN